MQMVRLNKNNFIYSNNMKTNGNELIRRLLSGITNDELQNLVRVREEARRPIPTPAPGKMVVKQLIRYFENNNLYKPLRPNKQQSRLQPGAHNPEHVTSILRLCNGVFTSRSIFR